MTNSLEFTNLPLAEVVCRFVFAEPVPISAHQWLDIMKRTTDAGFAIRDDSSNTFELPPGRAPQLEIMAINKLAFTHTGSGVLVRVQRDLVASRWDASLNIPYPRFRALADALRAAYAPMRDALGGTGNAASASMVYANRILLQGATLGDAINRYLSKAVMPEVADGAVADYNVAWQSRVMMESRLTLIRHGGSQPDEPEALVLVTSAGVEIRDGREPAQALEDVHSELQQMFLKVISDQAREEWGHAS